ncbi:MAG: PIN domain-containing protein [Defluviitaleaceae bacterium]|nr:PIN domain-containing protein [Defluviitaleaceae bacterium]
MSGKVFLDTNVFVYTQSKSDTIKRNIASIILETHDCFTSTQVFSEISNVMIKKLKLSISEVKQIITAINDRCEISIIDFNVIQKALDLKEIYGYSYYDSLILAAAVLSDCDYIFSEDLHDGQIIDGKAEIVNIFKRSI